MGYKDWYTVDKEADGYRVTAVDADFEFQKQYRVFMKEERFGNCECFAGHTWCRHKKIIVEFNKKALVGTKQYFNFDKNKWLKQPNLES